MTVRGGDDGRTGGGLWEGEAEPAAGPDDDVLTARAIVRQLVSPGKRPITLALPQLARSSS